MARFHFRNLYGKRPTLAAGFNPFFLNVRRQHERAAKRAELPLRRVKTPALLLVLLFLFTAYGQDITGQTYIEGFC